MPDKQLKIIDFLSYGFRPFFLLASVFSIIHIGIWTHIYLGKIVINMTNTPIIYWHAHEMIFGYSTGIIAGFLLTAVTNWTKLPTIHGYKLAACVALWLSARLTIVISPVIAMVFDLLFVLTVIIAISIPIYRSKNKRQLIILINLLLLLIANTIFYLALLKVVPTNVIPKVTLLGFYTIISIVLLLSRRVIPFFISNSIKNKNSIKNNQLIDKLSILLLLFFIIIDSFFTNLTLIVLVLSVCLFIIHSIRSWYWYHPSIWKNPLLWSIWFAYVLTTTGFLVKALVIVKNLSPSFSIHTFAFGGIGLMTLAMMSRVSLGHTGRNINSPNPIISYIFILIIFGFIFRVLLPIIFPKYYFIFLSITG